MARSAALEAPLPGRVGHLAPAKRSTSTFSQSDSAPVTSPVGIAMENGRRGSCSLRESTLT
ncbi:hypothetical protein T02_12720 [Trichinella nativa]|uniref:Uncharacterized protein n=1 Tax=Trichinella nativa TaxID=6335 RepID=A0A0V1KMA3_9BILA|nr:hypothetical protein T02_12720 [Trichinella nativa]